MHPNLIFPMPLPGLSPRQSQLLIKLFNIFKKIIDMQPMEAPGGTVSR